MSLAADDPAAPLRRWTYGLLIVIAVATLAARIYHVQSSNGRTPFLSANDRSRWATIRALVDHGTYSLDDVIYRDGGQMALDAALDPRLDPLRRRDSDWYSIDMVRHRGVDGAEHAYSSKPPLLSTMLAAEYWVLQRLTGATLVDQPFYVGCLMLILSNLVPLALAWCLLIGLVERFGTTDWGRVLVMAGATWGTLLSPMAVTLNNHLPAAVCVTVLIVAMVRIWDCDTPRLSWYALAGFAAAMTAANELPALSLVALSAVALALRSLRATLLAFAPAAGLVAVAAVATNYAAHGTWKPPYAHRHDGPIVANVRLDADRDLDEGPLSAAAVEQLVANGVLVSTDAVIHAAGSQRWRIWDPNAQQRWVLQQDADRFVIRQWDNWYDYEGSYWTPDRLRGVDRGEPSRLTYATHVLVGHHGIFSLTPFWCLSLVGCILALMQRDRLLSGISLGTAVLTLVCLAFYVARPLIDRNYGGVSCGFRWLFWFAPLWLVVALPAADATASHWSRRALGFALLAASVFAAQWSTTNPWSHPWLFEYWTKLGWISY